MQGLWDLLYDEDDEEMEQGERVPRVLRVRHMFRPRINYFEELDEKRFVYRFRLSKQSVIMLLNRIQHRLEHVTNCNNAISPMVQLLVALRFYATGSLFVTMADFCGISKMSACRIVHRVSPVIASLSEDFIRFPAQPDQIRQAQREFFEISGCIKVIGAIHCGENAELHRNRKGYFSINVQAIVNARLEIIDIVARWPGATHDSTIFDNSRIKASFEAGRFGDGILLGDSGYPNLPYLMTPLNNPATASEQLYNEAQIRTRCVVERAFGIWSRQFAVLNICSRFSTVERTLAVIVATAVLHNIARQARPPNPLINGVIYDEIPQIRDIDLHGERNVREHMINNYFHSLL
ncbi:PREDICTED: putative nuclease HARBI1 [Vollenhovia emeryi]|uniref:putative nuclease HARBI1 n=1 Tax=Vollenhovia emeryi TaxID=411798 RepID=UPI0005F57D63|nr:PREDICTED: putative nuclease HARBI1 [Vollenhovia emeryi]